MKLAPLFSLLLVLLATAAAASPNSYSHDWEGTWAADDGDTKRVLLIIDNYWTQTVYQSDPPRFIRSFGGTFDPSVEAPRAVIQFDSEDAQRVGSRFMPQVELEGDEMRIRYEDGSEELWSRQDDRPDELTGVWRISGRQRDGEIQGMPLRARRTLKVLTGSRFQWIAMNVETGEFSGTGGGSYTFTDGTYTEHIEFFSRDDSRVGASLEFEGKVKDDAWHHSGLSSRGDPIYEIWTRFDPR